MDVGDFGFVEEWFSFLLTFFAAKGLGVLTTRKANRGYFIAIRVPRKMVILELIFCLKISSMPNCLLYKSGSWVHIWMGFGFMEAWCPSGPDSTEGLSESLSSDYRVTI